MLINEMTFIRHFNNITMKSLVVEHAFFLVFPTGWYGEYEINMIHHWRSEETEKFLSEGPPFQWKTRLLLKALITNCFSQIPLSAVGDVLYDI